MSLHELPATTVMQLMALYAPLKNEIRISNKAKQNFEIT
jgi:hypothetical protein